jgi:hypothetical protein|tara:strand:+ start:2222 stop:2368 length:147 start_codon:yes stop_codon:yes gene_type:complete
MNIPTIDGEKSESWMAEHQHRLAMIRTVTSFLGMVLSAFIALKVFGAL